MKFLKTCPVGCNSELSATSVEMPEGNLLQCSNCEQLISQCSEDYYFKSMQDFDVKEGTNPKADSISRSEKLHFDRLKMILKANKLAPEDVSLMDVGCSSGTFLDTARKMGFKTYGVDPAQKAAQTALEKGHDVKSGMLEDLNYDSCSFDVITLFEVIEHLKEPIPLLQEMERILKPGGFIMISTGNSKSLTVKVLREQWDYFSIKKNGGHISFYNPYSICLVAEKVNLKLHKLITRNIKFATKGYVSKFKYRMLKVFSEILSPIAKRLNIGHDMIIILQK